MVLALAFALEGMSTGAGDLGEGCGEVDVAAAGEGGWSVGMPLGYGDPGVRVSVAAFRSPPPAARSVGDRWSAPWLVPTVGCPFDCEDVPVARESELCGVASLAMSSDSGEALSPWPSVARSFPLFFDFLDGC